MKHNYKNDHPGVLSCEKLRCDTGVKSKKQNYALWQNGFFGNKLRAWRSFDEWKKSGFNGNVALRVLGQTGAGYCSYDNQPEDVEEAINSFVSLGYRFEDVMINEMAPSYELILQGEYSNEFLLSHGRGYFLYSFSKNHMRDALKYDSKVAVGLMADLLIKNSMTPSSHDDWLLLIDRYPEHVFEVSIFEKCLGDIPGRNTLVWEIRKY